MVLPAAVLEANCGTPGHHVSRCPMIRDLSTLYPHSKRERGKASQGENEELLPRMACAATAAYPRNAQ